VSSRPQINYRGGNRQQRRRQNDRILATQENPDQVHHLAQLTIAGRDLFTLDQGRRRVGSQHRIFTKADGFDPDCMFRAAAPPAQQTSTSQCEAVLLCSVIETPVPPTEYQKKQRAGDAMPRGIRGGIQRRRSETSPVEQASNRHSGRKFLYLR